MTATLLILSKVSFMPPRLPTRIPKFTLYTGPQCSLRDDAKAALARAHVLRANSHRPNSATPTTLPTTLTPLGEGASSEGDWRPFDLDIINIRDKGQEHWLRRYVYWIPALHLDGKEVAKGRWGESEILKALEGWDKATFERSDESTSN